MKVIALRTHLLILNGIWKASRRGQSEATIWLVTETESRKGKLTSEALEVFNTAHTTVAFLRQLGFRPEIIEGGTEYLLLSKTEKCFRQEKIYQLSVMVKNIKNGDIKSLRNDMFTKYKKLPRKEKRESHKRKQAQ